MATLIVLILGLLIAIDDEVSTLLEQFTPTLIIGFIGDASDDIAYQIITSTNLDSTDDDYNDETELDTIVFSINLTSFFTFFSSISTDLAFNTIESLTVVSSPFIIIILFGFDNILNETYNGRLAAWLWPFFTILEILTVLFRCLSLSIRITSNGLAGHILVSLLTLGSTILLEYSVFWYLQLIAIILVLLTITVQIMEFLVTCIQSYVWVILSINYTSLLS